MKQALYGRQARRKYFEFLERKRLLAAAAAADAAAAGPPSMEEPMEERPAAAAEPPAFEEQPAAAAGEQHQPAAEAAEAAEASVTIAQAPAVEAAPAPADLGAAFPGALDRLRWTICAIICVGPRNHLRWRRLDCCGRVCVLRGGGFQLPHSTCACRVCGRRLTSPPPPPQGTCCRYRPSRGLSQLISAATGPRTTMPEPRAAPAEC